MNMNAVTPAMIEAAAKALYLKDRGVPDDAWERDLPDSTLELWRGYALTALTAALARQEPSENEKAETRYFSSDRPRLQSDFRYTD